MVHNIPRSIFSSIEKDLFTGKIIILYGPRQVGKTTLSKELLKKYGSLDDYYNCDESDIVSALENATSTELKNFFGATKLIVIDEAQRVRNIGITLKLLIDTFPDIQIIATGSSSFELANTINEPLTGRKYEYHLFPFSFSELDTEFGRLNSSRTLEERLIYGSYPVVFEGNKEEKIRNLREITTSYLFKDIFTFGIIRKSETIQKLLTAIALQIGSQVSYTELASLVGVDKNTVERYIDILEQAFIIFRLPSYARNERNELKFSKKIYFYDIGIRNALIGNLNPLSLRTDTGALWENYLLAERKKYISYKKSWAKSYFWRNTLQREIDYIEEENGYLSAYEFKWGDKLPKAPKNFTDTYPDASYKVVNQENYSGFLI